MHRTLVTISMVLGFTSAAVAEMSAEWVEKWRRDLESFEEFMPETHANLFHTVDPEEFRASVAALSESLPSLEHHEAAVELARIVATIGDGHTRLTLPLAPGVEFEQGHSSTPAPAVAGLLFHQYPIRFGIDSSGVWVKKIGAEHAAALGGRVVAIGGLSAGAAMAAVSPAIRRDNEMQVKHHLPMFLVLAEVLHARGVINELGPVVFSVEARTGERLTLELEPVVAEQPLEWLDVRDLTDAPSITHLNRRFYQCPT